MADVTVDELVVLVNIGLGDAAVGECRAGDYDENTEVTVDEILDATRSVLDGCAGSSRAR